MKFPMHKIGFYSFLVLTIGFLISGTFFTRASAQLVSDSDISISLSPQIPAAFQDTTVTLNSFSVNLDTATIAWTLNGKEVLSGIGKKSYSFKTGNIDTDTNIDVSITVSGVPLITKKIIVRPNETDLLWEAVDSYVPPFYKGKALPSSEGTIKIVALPNIKNSDGIKLKANDFSYDWKENYDSSTDQSGYGKNSFTIKNSYLNDVERVGVSLTSIKDNLRAEKTISISTTKPSILFYESDPEGGVRFEKSVTDRFALNKENASIVAVPMFFSPKNSRSNELSYSWTINGKPIAIPEIKNLLPIRGERGSKGIARIGLSLENTSKLFQSAEKNINIILDL